jgi:hypothetical protein
MSPIKKKVSQLGLCLTSDLLMVEVLFMLIIIQCMLVCLYVLLFICLLIHDFIPTPYVCDNYSLLIQLL